MGPPLIGPNALIQTAAALRALEGEEACRRVFARARLEARLAQPPGAMVPAAEAARLMAGLAGSLPPDRAAAVAAEAGRRTADYLLAHRIPAAARALLPRLPLRLASWLLGRAIVANAWTFAAGAAVRARLSRGAAHIEIDDAPDPLTEVWRCAVFARLFAVLVAPRARARPAPGGCAIALA